MTLQVTKNHLGFAGTYLLAEALKPHTLVMRGLNPRCADT